MKELYPNYTNFMDLGKRAQIRPPPWFFLKKQEKIIFPSEPRHHSFDRFFAAIGKLVRKTLNCQFGSSSPAEWKRLQQSKFGAGRASRRLK